MSKVLSNNNTPEENLEYLRSALPLWESGTNKGKVNWKNSIGCTIEYEYEWYGKIYTGSLTIERYERKEHNFYLNFEGIEKGITTSNLQICKLGGILNLKTNVFKFEVGDIVNGLLIIDREYKIITTKSHTQKRKYYKYRCTCTNEGWITESNLNDGKGCNACGDGVSYPEKFIYSLLEQLNVKFEMQFSNFDWINNIRYDFYIPSVDLILEVHGGQHGKFITKGELIFVKKTKGFGNRDDIKIDAEKCWLAYDNGIENYIQLDCNYSDMEYIKNSVLNSELAELFDLSKVDWNKCNEFALGNLIREVCDYWKEHKEINGENITTKDVGEVFRLNRATVIRYLQKGTKLGWCNYDPKEESKKSGKTYGKVNGGQNNQPIYCPELNRIFTSIMDVEKELKLNSRAISNVLTGRAKTSGKLPDGTKLHWQYVDKDSNYYKNYLISKQKKVA